MISSGMRLRLTGAIKSMSFSITFNAQLKVAGQVVSENPHLYYEIQQGNEMTGDVVDHFRRVLDELARSVRDKDEGTWTRAMEIANDRIAGGG